MFPRPVVRAVAALSGYSAQFGDNNDHHLGRLEVVASAETIANAVTVRVSFGLRDWSGNWDDEYVGLVDVTVFAELEAPGAPVRRTDLMITGIETTQVIQHFRSSRYLSSSEGGPDNSILLIARKDTALRVYVDYSPHPSTPPFNLLSGEVKVQTSTGASVTLAPLSAIQPRSDASIERAIASHTLNFVIPEVWCQGEIEFSCEVFDNAAPTLRSTAFRRTLRFAEVTPLSTFAVGVHYTGQGLNLNAPSMADAISTLDMAMRLFPVGEILVNGYTTIDFNKDMNANIADGCGSGFNDLLDVLRDLRGDSEDLYWAVLPAGINTGSVGGCGSDGVAAQFAGDDRALAEEFGHALGRKHAPAGTSPAPANPDEGYPTYGDFPSGSIGEVGYDPATNNALDPAATFDFMGYAWPEWISPYTYIGLLSQMPTEGPYPSSTSAQFLISTSGRGGEARRQKHESLFLRLSISRDRKVSRDFLFHFPAFPSRSRGVPTDFMVEFLDSDFNPLSCSPLRQVCIHCHPVCWPKRFRQSVPFPSGARWIVIWDGREKIYEESIPDPPQVRVTATVARLEDAPGISVQWEALATSGAKELIYVVQWQDAMGNWRGVAPRTAANKIFIPTSQLQLNSKSSSIRIRTLATSGIATGIGEVKIDGLEIPRTDPKLVLHGEHSEKLTISPLLRISTVGEGGAIARRGHIRWFDEQGREIGRGRTLDLRLLPLGQHRVHADAVHLGVGTSEGSWLVERTHAGVRILGREHGALQASEKKAIPVRQTKD